MDVGGMGKVFITYKEKKDMDRINLGVTHANILALGVYQGMRDHDIAKAIDNARSVRLWMKDYSEEYGKELDLSFEQFIESVARTLGGKRTGMVYKVIDGAVK